MDEMKLQLGRTGENRFTVIERGNCILVEGSLSPDWLSAIAKMLPKKAIISPRLAGMMKVNFAFGLAADVDALIAAITPEIEAASRSSADARGISQEAAVWLASGERGNSSETMFTHLTGVNANLGSPKSHPYDPADLRRCMLLLDQVPELRPELHRMSAVSPAWAGLVRNWSEITTTLMQEWGNIQNPKKGAHAMRTYDLIKIAIGEK